jgi:hypothetical protein
MIEDIYNKASNNSDGEIWIRPSDYGFPHSSEGNEECIKVLNELQICKKIIVDGKDLLRIQV